MDNRFFDGNFRHEYKYICSDNELCIIFKRIDGLLSTDSHTLSNGTYVVRSLYFDDIDNSCFYENENGTDPREKYRIRIYNGDASRISLELKRKVHGKTQKRSCLISREICESLMRGIPPRIDSQTPPVLAKLSVLMRTRLFRPVTIVEYERTPFVYKEGNVRVTFDRSLSSSDSVSDFLSPTIPARPIMPPNKHLLEVKWDEFIPDPVFRNIGTDGLTRTAFSKYYLCRKYTLHGGTNL